MNWGTKKAISVAGGKGGIGKSSFVTNLGVALSKRDKKVTLIDADVGAANLHTLIGVSRPDKTIADFFKETHKQLQDVVVDTPFQNLHLLSSASDTLAITAPNYKMNQKLFAGLQKLDTDILVFDIEAGTNYRAIDFFSLAPVGIVIVEPLPTALENAFLFIKNLLFRYLLRLFYHEPEMKWFVKRVSDPEVGNKMLHFNNLLDELEKQAPEKINALRHFFSKDRFKMCIVANAVRDEAQMQVIDRFAKIVKRYLGLTPRILGQLPFETHMHSAISARTPFIVKYPDSEYARAMSEIAESLPT